MPYAIRVRLYRGAELEADTDPDPDLEPGAPGAEIVPDLAGSQRALVELCHAFHEPGAKLLGFGDIAMDAYGCMIRERAKEGSFSYTQGYSVLLGHYVETWRAHVDIAVSRCNP